MSELKPSSVGSIADIRAKVNIERVHQNYFSKPKNALAFVKTSIVPIESSLPKNIKYCDLGGGTGFLTKYVVDFLSKKGHKVSALIVDANQKFLDIAKSRGFKVLLENIEDFKGKDFDLATMRAVTHYNEPTALAKLLNSAYACLKKGGFLITQLSSGNKENCALRSDIVNLSELGRAGPGKYNWITVEEYLDLLDNAGFSNKVAGNAPPCFWTAEEQWDRFNAAAEEASKKAGDKKAISAIKRRKKLYLDKAYKIIERYVAKYGAKKLGVQKGSNNKYKIHYEYHLIVSQKV